MSVDEFKMARSAEGLSEPERILHQKLPILLNIIGFLDILWEFYGIFRSDTEEFWNQFWIYSGKTLRPFLHFFFFLYPARLGLAGTCKSGKNF